MKPVRVSRRTAIVGVTMYDVGQMLDGLGAILGYSDWKPGDKADPMFEQDGRRLYEDLMDLIRRMDAVGDRLDAGAGIDKAREP